MKDILKRHFLSTMILLIICTSMAFIIGDAIGATTADFTHTPDDFKTNKEVEFDASESTGEGLTFSWSFGDGDTGTGMIVNHKYEKAGTYWVSLTVINATGDIGTRQKEITVEDQDSWIILGAIIAFYLLFCGFGMIFYVLNIILGGIFAYNTYNWSTKNKQMEAAKPYLIAHLIAGLVGIFMWPLGILTSIAHLVIRHMFKNKMKEMGFDILKKGKKVKKKVHK